jgi:hypothetical protein
LDPHENLNVGAVFVFVPDLVLEAVRKYEESLKDHPNPPAKNITVFRRGD